MSIFISGGCKNGKSYYAQRLAKEASLGMNKRPLYYVATMRPVDNEDRDRIKRHVDERLGWGFTTIEKSEAFSQMLEAAFLDSDGKEVNLGGVFLVDSVTALLSNEMFRMDGSVDVSAAQRVTEELLDFAEAVEISGGEVVFVSDYIYCDGRIYGDLTEVYRKGLADVDRALAAYCQAVYEVTYSNVVAYKGAGWEMPVI